MRILSKISPFISGFATLALLAGCSSGGGGGVATPSVGGVAQQGTSRSVPPAHGHLPPCIAARPNLPLKAGAFKPFVAPSGTIRNATATTIAISDGQNSVVDLFNAQGQQTGQLTGFNEPVGLASDIRGDLYVADYYNGRIQVYAKGLLLPPTTITVPNQFPVDVDSFSNGAYVAVTNSPVDCGGEFNIMIFKGSTLVTTIDDFTIQPESCAFDATGNLYVDGYDLNGATTVGEVADATSGGNSYTTLTTTNAIGSPGGVQVTTSGQIAIGDESGAAIYTYNPPSNGSLGAPVQTTPLPGSQSVAAFAFTKNMSDLYVADDGLDQSNEYAYPAGGAPVSTIAISGGTPFGVAIIPTQFPKGMK